MAVNGVRIFLQDLEMVLRAKDTDQHYGVALSVIQLMEADPMVAEALIRSPKVSSVRESLS